MQFVLLFLRGALLGGDFHGCRGLMKEGDIARDELLWVGAFVPFGG